MSVWTHVAGIIRADGLNFDDNKPKPDWDKIIKKELSWHSNATVWDEYDAYPKRFMPCGSEGSLQKVIWENPDKSSLAAYTISIFGDLRDYGDLDAIGKWFTEVCSNLWVRNAVITAECELGSQLIAYYDPAERKVIIQKKETRS